MKIRYVKGLMLGVPKLSILALTRGIFYYFIGNTKNIHRPWAMDNFQFKWFSRSTWAIAQIVALRYVSKNNQRIKILVPDFFCSSALEKIDTTIADILFYTPNEELKLNVTELQEQIIQVKPDILLVVHYFGRNNEVKTISKVCNEFNVWLVQDCAHVFLPNSDMEIVGDFAFFSPYKHIAAPSGSLLILNENGPSKISKNIFDLMPIVEKNIKNNIKSIKYDLMWIIKRVIQTIGFDKDKFFFQKNEKEVLPNSQNKNLSNFSKAMIMSHIKMLETYKANKVNCNTTISNILKNIYGDEIYIDSEIESDYLLLLRCKSEEVSKKIYYEILTAGLPVIRWPDLPSVVRNEQNKYQEANARCKNHIYVYTLNKLSKDSISIILKKLIKENINNYSLREVNEIEWNDQYCKLRHNHIPQSWEYGLVKSITNNMKVRRYIVSDYHGLPKFIFQLTYKSFIFGNFGYMRVSKGPLFLSNNEINLMPIFMGLIKQEIKKISKISILSIAPNIEYKLDNDFALKDAGLFRLSTNSFASGILNLDNNQSILLDNLKQKWRNGLMKAKRLGTVNSVDVTQESISKVIEDYESFQRLKKFKAISSVLVRNLMELSLVSKNWNVKIYAGKDLDGNEVGSLVSIESGSCAHYFLGYSNLIGRRININSLLLWHSIVDSKSDGYLTYDLGGFDDKARNGVSHYKEGLNPKLYKLQGEFISLVI